MNMNVSRYKFIDVFQENPDGSLAPKRVISINGITFSPGIAFSPGVAFGGVDFHRYKYLDIVAEEREGVLIIRGFFK
jgi:hypothetical protein